MNLSAKPFAESCEENKLPILTVLMPLLASADRVLEIGSGTGQHAAYFAARLPYLTWLPSDLPESLSGIRAWAGDAAVPNLLEPLGLDVTASPWAVDAVDAVFSANTAHIMNEPAVVAMFSGVGRILCPGGLFILYGPFNYAGRYTSESNRRFDDWLKARDPASGIKDVRWLGGLATAAGMALEADCPMPVHNRTLIWRKI
jgi:SAM-dependent methyltransferase